MALFLEKTWVSLVWAGGVDGVWEASMSDSTIDRASADSARRRARADAVGVEVRDALPGRGDGEDEQVRAGIVGVRAHHRLGADAGIGAGLYSGHNNRPGVCGPGKATRPGEATKMLLE